MNKYFDDIGLREEEEVVKLDEKIDLG